VTAPVSLTLPIFEQSPRPFLQAAEAAARLGFSGVFVFDHLVPIGDPTRPVLEGASTLGAVAAAADTRVGMLVLRASLRGPEISTAVVETAAMVAPGRLVIALGAGDRMSDDEVLRLGLERFDRMAALETTLGLIKDSAPEVPVWLGGRSKAVRALAAARADGWNAWGAEADSLRREADEVREAAGRPITVSWGGGILLAADQAALDGAVSRRGGSEGVTAGLPGAIIEHLSGLIAAGADELIVSILPNRLDTWELFAADVLPELQAF
jgi:alkanesulfonate monooxygenase SsuD/methylene tetrahydromethanopterin reductase-like flavin-dependent oxidoreductase (luciferase family)